MTITESVRDGASDFQEVHRGNSVRLRMEQNQLVTEGGGVWRGC